MCVSNCVYLHVCVYMCISACVCLHVCIYMYVCVCICVYVCVASSHESLPHNNGLCILQIRIIHMYKVLQTHGQENLQNSF